LPEPEVMRQNFQIIHESEVFINLHKAEGWAADPSGRKCRSIRVHLRGVYVAIVKYEVLENIHLLKM
jgi:hypothetical protein